MNSADIKKAEKVLANNDPILAQLMDGQDIGELKARDDYFKSLCRSVIGQQISVAAAKTIYGRFQEITDEKPKKVLELTDDDKKKIGLSAQKAGYIKDIALHFYENPDVYNHLETQSDEQVIEELTEIKGIGEWTAQMFLMFTLVRPDVFAPGDAGLQRAIVEAYSLKDPDKETFIKISNKWKPYRTIASMHLWHSLDNNPDS